MRAQRLEFEFDLDACRRAALECVIERRPALCDGALIEATLAGLQMAGAPAAIANLELYSPLWIESDRTAALIVDVESMRFELRSRRARAECTRLHATGRVGLAGDPSIDGIAPALRGGAMSMTRLVSATDGAEVLTEAEFHALLARSGRSWGPGLRSIERAIRQGSAASAWLRDGLRPGADDGAFVLQPAVVESVLQLVALHAMERDPAANRLVGVERIAVLRAARAVRVDIRRSQAGAGAASAGWQALVLDSEGEVIAHFDGIRIEAGTRQREREVALHAAEVLGLAREVLGLDDLDAASDLVTCGATSLDLTRLLSALRGRLGWAPAINRLLLQPTAFAVAECFVAEEPDGDEPQSASRERRSSRTGNTAAVSHGEQRLWYLERFGHVSPAYNEAAAWQIDGDLDVEAFERSLARVVARHDILRTSFPEVAGLPHRRVASELCVPLRIVDLGPTADESALTRALGEEARYRFDLESGPLLRATLFRLGPQRQALLIAAHHIVCDGWSVGLLCDELQAGYRALRGERTPGAANGGIAPALRGGAMSAGGIAPALRGGAMSARPLQMAEYADSEQRRAPERLDALLDIWAAELTDAPTLLELPADRPRPRVQSHRGARVTFELEPASTCAVRALARQIGATPFAVTLAAFQVLIHRHTGQNQFLIGVPFSLRDDAELETVFGCLVNTVPIRAGLTSGMTLLDAVECSRIQVARALALKDAPLDQLVARLRCDRSLSRTPLIQAAFSYSDLTAGELSLPGCAVRPLAVETASAKFDLTMQLNDRGDRLTGFIEYASDLFDPQRVQRLAEQFGRTLAQLGQDASVEIGGEWLFDEAQRAELARFGSGPTVAACSDLLANIDRHLTDSHARLAVICGAEQLTYGELASQVSRIEALLAAHMDDGAAPIALCAGRSCAWVAGVLAILRLGRGYLPIDPQTPSKRALQALRDCGTGVLLYSGAECDWADDFAGVALELSAEPGGSADAGLIGGIAPALRGGAMTSRHELDRDWWHRAGASRRRDVDWWHRAGASRRRDVDRWHRAGASRRRDVNRTFYAITTSGSTGTPKTAAVSYRAFANLHDWYCDALAVDADARVLVATSVAFDLTQKNVFAALASGARLILRSESTFDPAEVRDLIETQQVTVMNCTPSLFYPLVDGGDEADHVQLASLRHVVLGGESIDLKKLEPWRGTSSCHAKVINSYGPTECTDVCAACELDVPAAADVAVPIGRPIPNVVLHVLDPALRAVPLGVVGELYIAGAGLGQGYLGSHGTSQTGFVELATGPAYRTGDLVRYRWDGQLEFLGRADNQVKVRGYRVNLEEIEVALRQHPGVMQAVVATSRAGAAATALHAYYVAERELERSELRFWLSDALPRYMVPSSFTRVAQLPLTRSGKVDRLRLPEPGGVADRPPLGDLEQGLHAVFRELLGVVELGVDDDFFDVGGHSLLAIRVVEQVELRLRRACRVADLFERPTIKELAELLNRREPGPGEAPLAAAS